MPASGPKIQWRILSLIGATSLPSLPALPASSAATRIIYQSWACVFGWTPLRHSPTVSARNVSAKEKNAPVLPGAFHDIIRLKQSLLSLETLF